MAKKSLKTISSMMKGIDLCMLTTAAANGKSSSRPMSNNGKVDYDGTSYFFTWMKSRMVKEIKKNKHVSLQMHDSKILKKTFISVSGQARLTTDRIEMEENWSKDLEIWFEDGIDTKGIVMIEVKAAHIKYWSGQEEGEWAKPVK